jgi:holo-[acyl-carrier protein] synthase
MITAGRREMRPPASAPEIRVGVDLVNVAEVAESIANFGDKYLRRIYTPHEIASCSGSPSALAEGLAARFAAKEAAIKVLAPTGARPEWTAIEVRRQPAGRCEMVLHGTAADLAASAGITELTMSMTHERGMAAAVVLGRRPVEHARRWSWRRRSGRCSPSTVGYPSTSR